MRLDTRTEPASDIVESLLVPVVSFLRYSPGRTQDVDVKGGRSLPVDGEKEVGDAQVTTRLPARRAYATEPRLRRSRPLVVPFVVSHRLLPSFF